MKKDPNLSSGLNGGSLVRTYDRAVLVLKTAIREEETTLCWKKVISRSQ
jgi:hypothetical protein